MFNHLRGVYAAAITPLNADYTPDLAALTPLLEFLHERGCHGALLLGTTGEGPSFSPSERIDIMRSAVQIRTTYPDFRLMAGTGTPSLSETVELTQAALEIGYDGVVVLPPYYFRKSTDDGLFSWFSQVIEQAVPPEKALFGYHIPAVSSVPLSIELVEKLNDAYPDRFAGIKDSSGDREHAINLGEKFKRDVLVFNGNDRLFSLALQSHAAGCITALANLCSPDLRLIWERHHANGGSDHSQERLNGFRTLMEGYQPFPPAIKTLLAHKFTFPAWSVMPPLTPLPENIAVKLIGEMDALGNV